MARTATIPELIKLLAPHVGAKAFPQRDPASRYGAYLPRTHAVDVLHISNSLNCDIREVTPRGIKRVFDGHGEFIAWADVQSITIRSLDAEGRTIGSVTYTPSALKVAA